MEVTKIIAKFVVESSYADIPGKVRHEATRTVLNWVGCAVGGCRHETIECALAANGSTSCTRRSSTASLRGTATW